MTASAEEQPAPRLISSTPLASVQKWPAQINWNDGIKGQGVQVLNANADEGQPQQNSNKRANAAHSFTKSTPILCGACRETDQTGHPLNLMRLQQRL